MFSSGSSLMSAVVELRPEIDERAFRQSVDRAVDGAGNDMVEGLDDAGREAGDRAGDRVAAGLKRGVDQGARSAESRMKAWSGNLAKFGAVTSASITLPVVALFRSSIQQAEEAERATALRAQIFESMGGTMSAAAQQADAYATALGKTIAVDNDQIAAVQSKAATFRNLWSDQATGVETFNRAVALAFDMQAAGFSNAEEGIVMIAKAVSDPEMAAALKRTGALTSAQAEAVKKMAEGGQVLEAQQYLLKALEDQVGGTAEATVTDTQRMRVEWEALQEEIGMQLVPVLKEDVLPVVKDLLGWFSGLEDGTKKWIVMGMGASALLGPLSVVMSGVLKLSGALLGLAGRWFGVTTAANVAAGAQARAAGAGAAGGAMGVLGKVAVGAGALYAGLQVGAWLGDAVDWGREKLGKEDRNTGGQIRDFYGNLGIPLAGGDQPPPPPLAKGGTIRRSGTVLVGEEGPELLSLPRGAQVTPLDGSAAGVAIYGPITIVANDPTEMARQLDRVARRAGGTTRLRRTR